ncbi:MAG: hypothetical protein ACP5O0_04505 [Acidimicrobiales bacterium]
MLSRIRWFSLGLGVGSYLVLKGERMVRSKVEALEPSNVIKKGGEALVGLSDDLVESFLGGIDTWRGELSKARGATVLEGRAEEIALRPSAPRSVATKVKSQRRVQR